MNRSACVIAPCVSTSSSRTSPGKIGSRNSAALPLPIPPGCAAAARPSPSVPGSTFTARRTNAGTAADTKFSKVYLSGGTAKIPALFKTIEARVGVPVEIMNPFKNIEIDNRRFDPGFIMDVAPMAAVAVGLALRRPGDKLD